MSLRLAAMLGAVALLSACGTTTSRPGDPHEGHDSDPAAVPSPPQPHAHSAAPVRHLRLRKGERRVTVRLPEPYTPKAPIGVGTDDYRCFLLDPDIGRDSFITGFNVLPGSPAVVHHVIMFRVPPGLVAEAEQEDASSPGQGWTCFGDSGVGNALDVDDAPWLGAWAPGGAEQVYPKGFGEPFAKGSRIVMQVHYNLRAGAQPDTSATELRLAPATDRVRALQTRLLPAPVELPCRRERTGKLCDRANAVTDVKARFGAGPGGLADGLHFLCGPIKPGPVQSCTRTVMKPETVRAVAGHMHLLGRSIRIEANPGTPRARTLLDIPRWDFDNQGSRPIRPVHLEPLDRLKVTCRHSQELRDRLPAFAGQPERYVVWGEGTTDEMCLGIMLVTRP